MLRAIKIELIKAFDNIYFRLILLFEIVVTTIDYYKDGFGGCINTLKYVAGDETGLGKTITNDFTLSTLMLWSPRGNHLYNYLIMILPIIATIPFGSSYLLEKKNGLINQYIIKGNKKNYYIAKLVAVFVNAGTLAVIPSALNLAFILCFIPFSRPEISLNVFPISAHKVFSSLYYNFPVIYIFIFFIYTFVIFGLLNTICLSMVYLIDNVFTLIISPFVYYYGTLAFFRATRGYGAPSMYICSNMQKFGRECLLEMIIQIAIILAGIILYLFRTKKDVI